MFTLIEWPKKHLLTYSSKYDLFKSYQVKNTSLLISTLLYHTQNKGLKKVSASIAHFCLNIESPAAEH